MRQLLFSSVSFSCICLLCFVLACKSVLLMQTGLWRRWSALQRRAAHGHLRCRTSQPAKGPTLYGGTHGASQQRNE